MVCWICGWVGTMTHPIDQSIGGLLNGKPRATELLVRQWVRIAICIGGAAPSMTDWLYLPEDVRRVVLDECARNAPEIRRQTR